LLFVWIVSATYVAHNLHRGWVPHDEGTYAESGARILTGQLPYRDFDDLYTGGLGMLNALFFRMAGMNLFSMRIALFVFFLPVVPAFFYLAHRLVPLWWAAALTLLAVAWTVPNYSAAVPNWYSLFFGLFGVAALFRFVDTRLGRWLFFAGVAAGCSVLIKISGFYFMAAVFLFLVFHVQNIQNGGTAGPYKAPRKPSAFAVVVTFFLVLFVASLSWLVRNAIGIQYTYHFVVPAAALCALLGWRGLRTPEEGSGPWRSSSRLFGTFLGGVACPIAVFLAPYLLTRSTGALLYGVFVLPQKHLIFTTMDPPELGWIFGTLALAAALIFAIVLRGAARAAFSLGIGALLIVAFVYSTHSIFAYRASFRALSLSIPIAVLCGVTILFYRLRRQNRGDLHDERLFLLLSAAGICSFVQFPFAAPIYFCFVAPLLILSVAAMVACAERPPRLLCGILIGFYLVFAVYRTVPGFIYALGFQYQGDEQTHKLTVERGGGLMVGPQTSQTYNRLIPIVRQHATGEYIYAAPDCPEVYFLSGHRNPTRTFFDFTEDPLGRTARILDAIRSRRVSVVVFASEPAFSKPVATDLRAALDQQFPQSEKVGRFEVRWR
jgi:hypothetical protein